MAKTYKKNYFGKAVSKIHKGIEGYNMGILLPDSMAKLNDQLCGVQRGTYYLIGARLKVGKTAISDSIFLYNSYDRYKELKGTADEIELDIDYFSFEIDTPTKILNGISRRIFLQHGIYLPVKYIMSKGKFNVSQEHYDLITSTADYFEELEDVLTIHDEGMHPTLINNILYKKALSKGKASYNHEVIENTGAPSFTKDTLVHYESIHPNRYHLAIVDHAALTKSESGKNKKETIDTLSNYLVENRDKYGITPVLIQQFSSWSDENESKFKRGTPVPTLDSFSDSKHTPRDANVIMALHDPYSYVGVTESNSYRGYPIDKFRNNFRGLEIMRNRDGTPNIHLGLFFFGGIGEFNELCLPDYFNGKTANNGMEKAELDKANAWLQYNQQVMELHKEAHVGDNDTIATPEQKYIDLADQKIESSFTLIAGEKDVS